MILKIETQKEFLLKQNNLERKLYQKKKEIYEILNLSFVEIIDGKKYWFGDSNDSIDTFLENIVTIDDVNCFYKNADILFFKEKNLKEIPEFVSKFKNLKVLTIKNSNIEKISNINNLKKLEELDLSGNEISKIEGLENCVNLVTLNLTNNIIETIEGLDNCINLENLNMHENHLKLLPNINYLKKLKYLYLSNNFIQSIYPLKLDLLYEINLNSNYIKNLKGIEFINPNELYISNNKITKLEYLDNFTNLNTLDVTNNPLKYSKFPYYKTLTDKSGTTYKKYFNNKLVENTSNLNKMIKFFIFQNIGNLNRNDNDNDIYLENLNNMYFKEIEKIQIKKHKHKLKIGKKKMILHIKNNNKIDFKNEDINFGF